MHLFTLFVFISLITTMAEGKKKIFETTALFHLKTS